MILTSVTLYGISQLNFFPCYIILVVSVYQVFLPCLFGSLLIHKGEEYYDNISQVSWYELPTEERKSVVMLLRSAIEINKMSAGLTVISLEEFVEVDNFTSI
jgi:hypothetical protein